MYSKNKQLHIKKTIELQPGTKTQLCVSEFLHSPRVQIDEGLKLCIQ